MHCKFLNSLLLLLMLRGEIWSYGAEKQDNKRILLSDPDSIQQRLLAMEENIRKLTTENLASQQSVNNLAMNSNSGGAMYVRWGRKTCPDNETEKVYSGYAGGSPYDQYGSAAEYVCLPPDPLWNAHTDTSVNRNGRMQGAEYESGYFGKYHAGSDDVPCVVCRSKFRQTTLMIPARNQCYSGWKQEYEGNLASGALSHKAASQFICVDKSPEVVTHGQNDDDGKLLYAVEGVCGNLPCPPYENGRELSCVVCTK